jgi:PAS domain S-box-containing protein
MFINSPVPTMLLDNSRRILDVNGALCEMWGFERSQFVGRITDAFSQDRIEYDDEEWSKFLLAGASIGQRNICHSTGTLLGVQYAVKTVSPGLNIVAIVATRPGGLPRSSVYYRPGTTGFMF